MDTVEQALFETERVSQRERDLPAHVIYYSIAPALHLEVSMREVMRFVRKGVRWLGEPRTVVDPAANRQAFRTPTPR
ncbi:transposase domain-containing protein [Gemmatimonas sp.]|uniref:transposase domain-containing protein n=1 Tax=Gemmatimonas sp. TaxID=1962908 RepID=UPI003569A905